MIKPMALKNDALSILGGFDHWAALIIVAIHFYLDNAVAYFFGYRNERFGERCSPINFFLCSI